MSGLVVSKQQFIITLGNMLPDATIPWIEMVYDLTVKGGFVLLNKKALEQIANFILSLYQKADHLSHEDERNSCAYFLNEMFGLEVEKGMFGELLLKSDAQEKLKEILEGAEK